jgi:hypothetical protein
VSVELLQRKPDDLTALVHGYAYAPGAVLNRLSVPDEAAFNVGDLDVRWFGTCDTFKAPSQTPFNQWRTTSNQRAWNLVFLLATARLDISIDGTATVVSTAVPIATGPGFPFGVRFTRVAAGGATNCYISYDGVTWGTPVNVGPTSTGALFNSTADLIVAGGFSDGLGSPPAGRTIWAELRNGIDGPVVFRFDADTDIVDPDATTLTATTGQTITVVRTSPPALELVAAIPSGARGMPGGKDDWRFAVEVAIPEEGAALYDIAAYDEAAYSEVNWIDMTPDARGLHWDRGSDDPGGRPVTGSAELTLDNRREQWTPWAREPQAIYRRPGTLIRWGLWNTDYWLAQFSGVVESWVDRQAAHRRESWVEITLFETIGLLGTIDDHEAAAVGAGDTPAQRIVRLLADAEWLHGFYDETGSTIPMQATTMARNRLAELHTTGDSTDAWFRAHRSGVAVLHAVDPDDYPSYNVPNTARYDTSTYDSSAVYALVDEIDQATWRAASFFYRDIELRPDAAVNGPADEQGQIRLGIRYNPDSIVPANDTDPVVNDVRLARVGGSAQIAQDSFSKGRYGIKTLARGDLMNSADADVLAIAQAIRTRRANRVLRIESVTVPGVAENLPGLWVIDVGDPVCVRLPDNDTCVMGHIVGLEHSVSVKSPSGAWWETTISLETYPGFVDVDNVTVTVVATTTVSDVL